MLTKNFKNIKMMRIYATEIPSILGLNKHETPWMLFEKKIEKKHKFFGNRFTEHGNKYENAALLRYQNEKNINVEKDNKVLKHPEYNWLTGIVDGVSDLNKIIEIKCPCRKKRNITDISHVPKQYWVQCQVYMNLLNVDNTDYVEYFVRPGSPIDGNHGDITLFNIKKDDEWWLNNVNRIVNFYNELCKWDKIGSLDEHPVRIKEKKWETEF